METGQAADSAGVRLRLQRSNRAAQVLAIGALATVVGDGSSFSTREVAALYADLRLPAPGNLSDQLGRLQKQGLLVRPTSKTWALTPEGEERVEKLAADIPADHLAMELRTTPGAEFGQKHHNLLPPFLAPLDVGTGLQTLLADSEFDRNIMLITRYPKSDQDRLASLIPKLKQAVDDHGLNLITASDANREDVLWANVVTYMWGAKYAIAVVDDDGSGLNYNVLIELGGMLMTGRRCAILRDKAVPRLPTDLVGHIYKSVDLSDAETVVAEIHKWLTNDLRLPGCASCPA